MRNVVVLALLALLSACAPALVPGSEEACRVERVTSVPMTPPDPPATTRWSIEVALDGQPARMMLDSGASGLVVGTTTAARLGLRHRPDLQATAMGLGGVVYRRVYEIGSVAIGSQANGHAFAVEMTEEQEAGRGFDGIVGMGVFERNDVEIDFPARTLTLYRARFCPQGQPPWTDPFVTAARPHSAIHARSNLPVVPARLDGQQAVALLDTGATATAVDRGFARRLGVPDRPPPRAQVGTAYTMSEVAMPMWLHGFRSADIAGLDVEAPRFWILDLGMTADMIVGLDILTQLRMWISGGSDAVYIAPPAGVRPGR